MKTRFATALYLCYLAGASRAEDVTVVLQQWRGGYNGVQDVSIASDGRIKHLSFGGRKFLHLWPEGDALFVRFDLSDVPQTARVNKASLELFCVSVGFNKGEIDRAWPVVAYEARRGWAEGGGDENGLVEGKPEQSGATFLTSNGRTPWPNGSALSVAGEPMGTAVLRGPEHRWYRWDLDTRIVQEWVSGDRPNFGFILYGKPPGKAVSLASSESDAHDQHPILRLSLSVPRSSDRASRRAPEQPAKAARTEVPSSEEALALIRRLGGKVVQKDRGPGGPDLDVYLGGSKVINSDLAKLRGLTGLRSLSLFDTGVTDAGLAHIKELDGLENLDLSFSKVTDAGLVYLEGMTGLKRLSVLDTRVTRAGAERLKKALPELEITPIPSNLPGVRPAPK